VDGQHVDLTSEDAPGDGGKPAAASQQRPFLGLHFVCCDVYARVYVNRAGDAYQGNCPRCARSVRFAVGPGGTDARFYQVG
jgi:hypothetical protein